MIQETLMCLAVLIFHEARGESLAGQKAVANVAITRSLNSGKTVCEEIKRRKQFSWYKPEKEKQLFALKQEDIKKYGRVAIQAIISDDNTYGSSFFHSGKDPYWAKSLAHTLKIGNHKFYSLHKQKVYSVEEKIEKILN